MIVVGIIGHCIIPLISSMMPESGITFWMGVLLWSWLISSFMAIPTLSCGESFYGIATFLLLNPFSYGDLFIMPWQMMIMCMLEEFIFLSNAVFVWLMKKHLSIYSFIVNFQPTFRRFSSIIKIHFLFIKSSFLYQNERETNVKEN